MTQEIIGINGGRRQYWAELRTAYALIRAVTYRHKIARNAPTYTGRKIGAWDDYAKAIDAL